MMLVGHKAVYSQNSQMESDDFINQVDCEVFYPKGIFINNLARIRREFFRMIFE